MGSQRSVREPTADLPDELWLEPVVRELQDTLGDPLLAYVGGADSVAEVRAWSRGPVRRADVGRRLLLAREIVSRIGAEKGPVAARSWLSDLNTTFGRSPADVLREGGSDAVRRAAREFAAAAEWAPDPA